MKISASVKSSYQLYETFVEANEAIKTIKIDVKPSGYGSLINGGELLMLALATCFCNDIYREAAKRNIEVTAVEVNVSSEFGAEGEAGKSSTYKANVTANASQSEIDELVAYTDTVAEIQNTLRKGLKLHS